MITGNEASDSVEVEIKEEVFRSLLQQKKQLVVSIGKISYYVSLSESDLDRISGSMNDSDPSDGKTFHFKVTVPSDTAEIQSVIRIPGAEPVMLPVSVTMSLTSGERTVPVDSFAEYEHHRFVFPDQGSVQASAVMRLEDGVLYPVPGRITETEDGLVTDIYSDRSDGTFVWLDYQPHFTDVPSGHWAAASVQEMASRFIVSGTGDGRFEPDRSLTRAEATVLVTRAIGLRSAVNGNGFADVTEGEWFSGLCNPLPQTD